MVKTVATSPSMLEKATQSPSISKRRGRRILQVLKSAKKSANKCDVASPRPSRTAMVKKFAKKCGVACPRRSYTPAKVEKSTESIFFPELSACELACFGRAMKAFLNTELLAVLAPLFPPAATYRIIATAIELSQRKGIEAAFWKYVTTSPRTLRGVSEPQDIVAAILSIAVKLEGAFMWPHMGCHNDVPWKVWGKLLHCSVDTAKQFEWAMMHAFWASSSDADCSTTSTLFGEKFDSEFWAEYSEPRDID
jgi:hypothetical protein